MAIVSMDELVDALANSSERIPIFRQAPTAAIAVASPYSLWRTPSGMGGVAGSNPPTGVGESCTKATSGAVPFTAPGGADSVYLAGVEMAMTDEGLFTIYDRLVHTSGLSGTVTTAQTVNSAALPSRATGGANVEAWIEVYTAIGATSRTLTVSYTNQDGTSGRSGTVTVAISMKAGEMRPIALQGGDTGVRSVENVTWSGTTGTAGDFGITLLRRIASVAVIGLYGVAQADAFDLGLPLIDPNSCLAFQCDFDSFAARPLCGIVTFARG
jgi:hypothetical protein